MADAIVAVEYYMEMLQAGRPDPWPMLENAEQSLAALEPADGKVVVLRAPRPEPEPAVAPATSVVPAAIAAAPVGAPPPAAVARPSEEPAAPAAPTLVDAEFLQIFVEEARENIERLQILFPQWEENPLDAEALRDVRRVFHTLKGSGRMVGARRVSEFSWSIESLLNRVISQTLPRSSDIVDVVRDAVAVLPRLVGELDDASAPAAEVAGLMSRADALSGREATVAPAPAAAPAPAPAVEPPPPRAAEPPVEVAAAEPEPVLEPAGMDPVLQEIFRKETAGHVGVVRDFIERCGHAVAPYAVSEALYRACHTLSGIAKTAGVRQGIKVAEPMEHYVRKLYDNGYGLPEAGLELLQDTVHSLANVVEHVEADTGFFPDHGRLVAGWHALDRVLDAELANLTEAGERTIAGVWHEQGIEAPAEEVAASVEIVPEEFEPEFDADIAAIFSEEAGELLEHADVALSSWTRDRADRNQVTELKRVLHTLKGGARMAGIRAMGDLSHEMESFLAAVEGGDVAADADTIAVLQASLDELHRMRDAVNAGQRMLPANALIARVRAVAAASAAPPAAPVVVEQPVVTEPAEPAVEVPEAVAPVATAEEHVAAAEPPFEPEFEDQLAAEPVEAPVQEVRAPAEFAPEFQPVEPVAESAAGTAPMLPGREPPQPAERQELARVNAELLDGLLNNAGEVSIFRARIEQQMTSIEFNVAELGRTVTRLREQLRKLELETEAQILFEHQEDAQRRADFDPLELDRYSMIQQLSRALAESVSDVASLEGLLGNLNREGQNLLQQQGRVVAELQNGLMRTRMVPFQRHAQRLTRLVRQAAQEAGKKVDLTVEGGGGEIDRQVLERMLPPFEHMLRNAVVHGIERPEDRVASGKPETGNITVALQREGAEVVIVVEDDGAGLDIAAIRAKARHMGLLRPDQQLTDEESLQLILEPGFSTADRLTQQAGRGVGMDVVATEVKKLGGGLFIESTPGQGARFTIRLPFTLAITQSLIVRVHDEFYALPVATVEGVARLPRSEIERHLAEEHATFDYGGQTYRFQHLGVFVGSGPSILPETDTPMPVILVRAGEHSTALVTDELVGSREIVVKSVGPQVASVRGISGATILGDGRIVIILDMGALVRSEWRGRAIDASVRPTRDERIFVLVVDDSITVRRVTQRLLERNGMRVLAAKDGIDAMALLQEHVPDVILLDIEMPRMDGYEVATHIRNDPRLADVPIIMITSRVGDKHRARAIEIGVDDYLGKPYQESQLLDAIEPLVLARRRQPL
jgi:chemosensory pili system protein ChpA (sensor histidine kinase/response regulator)